MNQERALLEQAYKLIDEVQEHLMGDDSIGVTEDGEDAYDALLPTPEPDTMPERWGGVVWQEGGWHWKTATKQGVADTIPAAKAALLAALKGGA